MRHEDVKKILLQDQETKEEYDKLEVLYEIKREIIRLRTENKLSQAELAERVGTKQSAISRLEAGEYNPTLEFLAKVAKSLGKKIEIRFY
ncbi:MAG: helix-turn-helix transcriptional regulator [Bacillota bacterium]|nr:helix-turn-helix transcriptional regulator [Bacillota bacterium]